jgi:hypothetical protein
MGNSLLGVLLRMVARILGDHEERLQRLERWAGVTPAVLADDDVPLV